MNTNTGMNPTNQMNMGGFTSTNLNDPFESLENKTQNYSTSLNFNQPTMNEPPKMNQGLFSTGGSDPFASLEQKNEMNFGYQQNSQQTNMGYDMGMGFEAKKEEKKKGDFDFDLL